MVLNCRPKAPRLPVTVTVPAVPENTAVFTVPVESVHWLSDPLDQLLPERFHVPVPPAGLVGDWVGSHVKVAARLFSAHRQSAKHAMHAASKTRDLLQPERNAVWFREKITGQPGESAGVFIFCRGVGVDLGNKVILG